MGGNPSKPSQVDVEALRKVLAGLQQLQGSIGEGDPGSWDAVGNGDAIAHDVRGMQENVAQQLGQYYGDVTTHVNKSWQAIQTGISTLTSLIQGTIDQHSGADQSASTSARSVNTTQRQGAAQLN